MGSTVTGYQLRLAGVYATRWRCPGQPDTRTRAAELPGELADFYRMFEDQGPYQLPDLLRRASPDPATVRFGAGAASHPIPRLTSVEVLVFTLPFPADQVVASLLLRVDAPDLNINPVLATRILDDCMEAAVNIDGVDLAAYVDNLLADAPVLPVIPPYAQRQDRMPLERHQLVFIPDLRGAPPVEGSVIRRMLNGSRPGFTALNPLEDLIDNGGYAAVGARASFLSGHSDEVQTSVFLTTVQAVGTASRFQQIWQEAYHYVQQFQDQAQRAEPGLQRREDLAELADRMGNLELDLAFSVQTAADLGLNPSTRIESFHDALYDVMQVEVRARTVGQMFDRLGGSIRSELTAIESRERQEEDRRRSAGALAVGVLSFIIAPVTFLLGFFGTNVSQAHAGDSMWNGEYAWAYITAALLAVVPLVTVLVLRRLTRRHRAAAPGGAVPRPGG